MRVHPGDKAAGRNRNRSAGDTGWIRHLQPGIIDSPKRAFYREAVNKCPGLIHSHVADVWIADEKAVTALRAVVRPGGNNVRRTNTGNTDDVHVANGVQGKQAVLVLEIARLGSIGAENHANNISRDCSYSQVVLGIRLGRVGGAQHSPSGYFRTAVADP